MNRTTAIENDETRAIVRERYGKIAKSGENCGCSPTCCSAEAGSENRAAVRAADIGYSSDELAQVPRGAEMGLGCGNPVAIAQLQPGETVLDLGSGGGFDCFLTARQVGPTGKVIGVDMTPDMISVARRNAQMGLYQNH